jgi:hypothetical protein
VGLRKGISAFVFVLLLVADSWGALERPLPPPESVEEARQRLAFIRSQNGEIEAWVQKNLKAELDRALPEQMRAMKQGTPDSLQGAKERQMRVRMATAEVKARMRTERKEWLAREWERVLGAEIVEDFPVKLGPYDPDRKTFPLLLGFGWPSGLSITLHVSDRDRALFEAKFPSKVPAAFRINEQGEAHLLSIEKRWVADAMDIYVVPPGPRLTWESSHDSWVTAVAFRPDGSQVLSAAADSVVACRDADSGTVIFRLEKTEMAMSLAYSPDGASFATGGSDGTVRVRRATDGKERWKVKEKGMVMSVAYSPDGRHVATGGDAGFLKVYNAETGDEKFKVAADMPVRAIDFTRGGTGVVVGGERNRVLLWNLGSNKVVWRKNTEWPVYAVAASPSEGQVAAGGGGKGLLVLQESDGTESWAADTDGEVRSLRFDPAGRLLASGGAGYTAKVFSAAGGAPVWSAQIGSPIRALAFGADGRKLFVGTSDGGLRMFHVDEADRVQAAFGAAGRIFVDRNRVGTLFR